MPGHTPGRRTEGKSAKPFHRQPSQRVHFRVHSSDCTSSPSSLVRTLLTAGQLPLSPPREGGEWQLDDSWLHSALCPERGAGDASLHAARRGGATEKASPKGIACTRLRRRDGAAQRAAGRGRHIMKWMAFCSFPSLHYARTCRVLRAPGGGHPIRQQQRLLHYTVTPPASAGIAGMGGEGDTAAHRLRTAMRVPGEWRAPCHLASLWELDRTKEHTPDFCP